MGKLLCILGLQGQLTNLVVPATNDTIIYPPATNESISQQKKMPRTQAFSQTPICQEVNGISI